MIPLISRVWCPLLIGHGLTEPHRSITVAGCGKRSAIHPDSLKGGSFKFQVNVSMCKPPNPPTAKARLTTVWGFPLPVLCVYNLLTTTVKPVKSGLQGTSRRRHIGFPGKSSSACAATSKSSATTFFIIIDYLEPRGNALTKEKKKACSPSRKHEVLAMPLSHSKLR